MPVTTPSRTVKPAAGRNGFDRYFQITERGSTVGREIRGGFVTFFTMAYIMVLNPIILTSRPDYLGNSLSFAGVAATTAFVAGVMTILMGVFGRYPLALATGLGLNAQVATFANLRLAWPEIMGLVLLEGIVITLLVITGFRTAVFNAVPRQLKIAISVGIGMFLTIIGLVDGGFVRGNLGAPPLFMGMFNELKGWPVLVFIIGILLMAVLVVRNVKGAILIGILATTVLALIVEAIAKIGGQTFDDTGKALTPTAWQLNVPELPSKVVEAPDLSLIGQFSLGGGIARIGVIAAVMIVFTLMLADFFDTMGTVVAVGAEGKLLDDDGNLPRVEPVLLVDSLAAAAGGAASISSNTTYIESAAGVGDGARTGVASLVTGGLFLLAMFFTPLVGMVPNEAAAPALIIVGAMMMSQIKHLEFDDYSVMIPAFLTIALMPFTYSITNGIGAGFVSWVLLRSAKGKARDVHPLLWVVAALFVVYFALDPLKQLLGIS